ncbi:hypothetical protein BKA69DRAFT_1050800 [Paraphysoderma sedebokerense]|nr:hypothetical protein BKA69DRAFT_1050800 [Paraphysoderma sedebokerense]
MKLSSTNFLLLFVVVLLMVQATKCDLNNDGENFRIVAKPEARLSGSENRLGNDPCFELAAGPNECIGSIGVGQRIDKRQTRASRRRRQRNRIIRDRRRRARNRNNG